MEPRWPTVLLSPPPPPPSSQISSVCPKYYPALVTGCHEARLSYVTVWVTTEPFLHTVVGGWWCAVTADTNLNTDPFYFASYLIYDLRTSKIESRGSALLWRGTHWLPTYFAVDNPDVVAVSTV